MRQRVIAVLRRLGYAPQVEPGYACTAFGSCSAVQNVVAELPGREPGSAVVLAAHYDSVAAGPGVSDDLSGVAALLEVARILKAEPQPRNSLIFLLDEGEEVGLLGARTFENGPEVRNSIGHGVLFKAGIEHIPCSRRSGRLNHGKEMTNGNRNEAPVGTHGSICNRNTRGV